MRLAEKLDWKGLITAAAPQYILAFVACKEESPLSPYFPLRNFAFHHERYAVCCKYLRVNGEDCNKKKITASFDRFLVKQKVVRKILENDTEKEEEKSKGKLRNKDCFFFF
jgi:hypothetical protein